MVTSGPSTPSKKKTSSTSGPSPPSTVTTPAKLKAFKAQVARARKRGRGARSQSLEKKEVLDRIKAEAKKIKVEIPKPKQVDRRTAENIRAAQATRQGITRTRPPPTVRVEQAIQSFETRRRLGEIQRESFRRPRAGTISEDTARVSPEVPLVQTVGERFARSTGPIFGGPIVTGATLTRERFKELAETAIIKARKGDVGASLAVLPLGSGLTIIQAAESKKGQGILPIVEVGKVLAKGGVQFLRDPAGGLVSPTPTGRAAEFFGGALITEAALGFPLTRGVLKPRPRPRGIVRPDIISLTKTSKGIFTDPTPIPRPTGPSFFSLKTVKGTFKGKKAKVTFTSGKRIKTVKRIRSKELKAEGVRERIVRERIIESARTEFIPVLDVTRRKAGKVVKRLPRERITDPKVTKLIFGPPEFRRVKVDILRRVPERTRITSITDVPTKGGPSRTTTFIGGGREITRTSKRTTGRGPALQKLITSGETVILQTIEKTVPGRRLFPTVVPPTRTTLALFKPIPKVKGPSVLPRAGTPVPKGVAPTTVRPRPGFRPAIAKRIERLGLDTPARPGVTRGGSLNEIFGRPRKKTSFFIIDETVIPSTDLPTLIGTRAPQGFRTTPSLGISRSGFTRIKSRSKLGLGTDVRTSTLLGTETVQGTKTALSTALELALLSKLALRTGQITILGTGLRTATATKTATATRLSQLQQQDLLQEQEQILDRPKKTKPKPRSRTRIARTPLTPIFPPIIPPIPPEVPPTRPTPPRLPPTRLRPPRRPPRIKLDSTGGARFLSGESTTEQGYNVLIKRAAKKGKGFRVANTSPLTRNQAINTGASLVDKFTNRSFTIRKAGRAKPSFTPINAPLLRKFRTAKRNSNIFVEKTRFAIDSPEEKQGIPFKAARLRRAGVFSTSRATGVL